MSAKKSWDIQPKPRTPAEAPRAAAPKRPMEGMRRPTPPDARPAPVSTKSVTIARGKKARPESKEPLKKRRKKERKALVIATVVASVIAIGVLFYLAWLPALRVSSVMASGPHAEEAKQLAQAELYGTHFYILPRNSLFFIPERDMRESIRAAFPDIEAVSISANGLTSLSLTTVPRAEAFVWCGASREATNPCYSANAEGLIFAALPAEAATSTEALRFYGAIEGQEGESPIRAHIAQSARIPEALRFVKAMQSLNADVVSFTFRGDEGDLHTAAGTRITYVLGKEQEAAGIAASVFPQLALNDGSIQYVDLRFSGKAYFKRAEAVSAE